MDSLLDRTRVEANEVPPGSSLVRRERRQMSGIDNMPPGLSLLLIAGMSAALWAGLWLIIVGI